MRAGRFRHRSHIAIYLSDGVERQSQHHSNLRVSGCRFSPGMLRDLAPRFCQIPVLVAMDLLLSQRFMKDSQAALSHGFPLRDTLISMHIAIRDRNDAPGRVRPAAAIVPCAMRPS